jgi:hypothetical protein
MAGMLDNLLAQLQDYAASRPGGMPFDATPADEEDRRKKATPGVPDDWQAGARAVPAEKPQHYEVDYSSGIPVPYQDVKKNAPDLWDDDAKKFHEANPIPPTAMPPMAQGQAIPGLLGNQISAMPAGVGEPPAPVPQPPQAGSPAPQLPPAISVGAAPGTPPAPPVANPGAAPGGMPPQAPPQAPQMAAPGAGGPDTDVSARARGGVPAAAPGEPKGLLQRFDEFTQRNPALLLSLAAGFSGAGSLGTGMSRAFGAAPAGMAMDQKQALQTSSVGSTFRALVGQGVPKEIALAAAQNPEILKQIAPDYLTTRKSEIKEIKEKDGLGNERTRLVAVNPYDNSTRDVTPQNSGGHAAGVPGAGGFDGNQMFSRGVTMDNFDHNKVGADYLAQFSPEMQAAVNAYRRGGTLPTGRQQQAQVIKQIAQKYGEDIGDPVDDQTYRQRNEWATSLANTKSGVGLASKGFQQGLQHMAQLSDKLVEKGNYGGFGLEPVAETENWVRNLSTHQQDILRGIQTSAGNLSGETGKLFNGSSGGGVKERREMADRFGSPTMSGPAAAGALEAALESFQGGLTPLEARRDQLFPHGDAPHGSEFVGPAEKAAMEKIRQNIEVLRGNAKPDARSSSSSSQRPLSQATAAAPAGVAVTSTGVPWRVVNP